MLKRLQLGTSRLEKLGKDQLDIFLNKSWTHLGEEKLENPNKRPLSVVDYSKTNFIPFYFSEGDSLPFVDKTFSHIYSEHFFEHLFFDEAVNLFSECIRVLTLGGFMRVVVPDADLRKVPELLGYPGNQYDYSHPRKHKTRWSIYSLKCSLEMVGFKVIPIKYWNKYGNQVDYLEDMPLNEHFDCTDIEMVTSKKQIKRQSSLIVDGLKC